MLPSVIGMCQSLSVILLTMIRSWCAGSMPHYLIAAATACFFRLASTMPRYFIAPG